jgi:2-(1,2-epoxy-1,2-dihydrophenyl)acetyl-CoA isomerase
MGDSRTIDTGTEDLLARVQDRVAILTMNRPSRRNAFSRPMLEGLEMALIDAERSQDVACVVLTGAEGAFCSGGDVKGMADSSGGGGGN